MLEPAGHFSRGLHSPKTGRTFRAATPGMFSFNSPLGACPKCRGFGRTIDIDYRLAIPDLAGRGYLRNSGAQAPRTSTRSPSRGAKLSSVAARRNMAQRICPLASFRLK